MTNFTDKSRFRASNGVRLTKALFLEMSPNDEHTCYTLKDYDYKGFPSLYRLYMETNDLTEWEFATTFLEGWEHWEILCECPWFKPYVARWRKELYLRETSQALRRIKNDAADPESKNHFQANKILMDKTWEEKIPESKRRSAGRPTKEEVQGALKEAREEEERLQRDYERIRQSTTGASKIQ